MTLPFDISPESMRAVLGHFATGITIVTASGDAGPVGFTCQSFTSLSLEPALVSINPSRDSSSWPLVRAAGRFAVNILPAGAQDLAVQFGKKGLDRFDGVSWRASPHGNPHLAAALAWVDCELHSEYDGGDHSIAVGRVQALSTAGPAIDPLLFFRGRFAALQVSVLEALSA